MFCVISSGYSCSQFLSVLQHPYVLKLISNLQSILLSLFGIYVEFENLDEDADPDLLQRQDRVRLEDLALVELLAVEPLSPGKVN